MLAFNEGLLGLDGGCFSASARRPVSGTLNANRQQQDATARFARDLTSCESRTRIFVDGGVGVNRVDGNWTTRGLSSIRLEQRIGENSIIGVALIGSAASDELNTFDHSSISDQSLQGNLYGRTWLSDSLRFAAFAGLGRAWYDLTLQDRGLDLQGKMAGKRHLFGAALSGDVTLAGFTMTTDATLSRAVENLGSANLNASLDGESRTSILFDVGRVDITRLSVPVHVPIVFDAPIDGREPTRLELSPGFVCQETAQDSTALDCGYQFGLKFRVAPSIRSLLRVEARAEAVDGLIMNTFSLGFQRRSGLLPQLVWGVDISRAEGAFQPDNRVLVRFGIGL